jgi:tetratricopeptide (TPR) repeat protein
MNTEGFPDPPASPATRIRREIFQIAALIVVALVAFFATRAVAAHSRRTSIADAAEWYARGQRELVAGHNGAAVDAFRRASSKNRGERAYTLALARALELGGDQPAAERALLALRESAPEDSEVNLELGRLAASRTDLDDALRYYRNALYVPSAAADAGTRRAVRLELIRLLLAHDDRSRALAELLAAAADSPNDVASAIELGRLLSQAGDDRRAADQFARAASRFPKRGRRWLVRERRPFTWGATWTHAAT